MLTPGTRLGEYEIKNLIGRGGMGEVYRATDTRLKRDVALKLLPESLAADASRLTRLQREAELLASLNHSNIAALYGIEEANGMRALVMECVDGSTLEARIARGPIALDEALPLARQIAQALAAAHDAGVIHRDLKPANIKIRSDGSVKVLDFGLAKAAAAPDAEFMPDQTGASAETISALTADGVVLGTAAYMSPEQAKGATVDRRTDTWAFGCVLFEMLTGQRAFPQRGAADILAAVLTQEPAWASLPRPTPPSVFRLLQRCLQKDRRRRLRDLSDALLDLDEAGDGGAAETSREPSRLHRVALPLLFLTIGVIVGAVAAWQLARSSSPPPPAGLAGQFSISLPADAALANLDWPAVAVSPDGKRLAFTAGAPVPRLFVRELDDPTPRAVPGTDGAASPFFSPDSQLIAFFAQGRIKKVSVHGGDVVTVYDNAANSRGGAWNVDGTIAFTAHPVLRCIG